MKKVVLLIIPLLFIMTGCETVNKRNPYINQIEYEKIKKENRVYICSKRDKVNDTDDKKKDEIIEIDEENHLVKFGYIQSKNSKQYYEYNCKSYVEGAPKIDPKKDPGHYYEAGCDPTNFVASYAHFYVVNEVTDKLDEYLEGRKIYYNEDGTFDYNRWMQDKINREYECEE